MRVMPAWLLSGRFEVRQNSVCKSFYPCNVQARCAVSPSGSEREAGLEETGPCLQGAHSQGRRPSRTCLRRLSGNMPEEPRDPGEGPAFLQLPAGRCWREHSLQDAPAALQATGGQGLPSVRQAPGFTATPWLSASLQGSRLPPGAEDSGQREGEGDLPGLTFSCFLIFSVNAAPE